MTYQQKRKKLDELIRKKEELEKQILDLKNELSSYIKLSKSEKLSLFKSIFNISNITDIAVESHLRGQNELLVDGVIDEKVKYFVFEADIVQISNINMKLLQSNISAYYEKVDETKVVVWIFFQDLINLSIAQKLISYAIGQDIQMLPSPIALPLYLTKRDKGLTVFIDPISYEELEQWQVLQNISMVLLSQVNKILSLEMPIILSDFIYIEKNYIDNNFIKYFKDLTTFNNPQRDIMLRLGKKPFGISKYIYSWEEDDRYFKLPKGVISTLQEYLKSNNILYSFDDKRVDIPYSLPKIKFKLRAEQEKAIEAISRYQNCLCIAPPGFGKTLIGSYMIYKRGVNSLVIVNKNLLLDQWIDRFILYFEIPKKDIGYLGKGKNKLNNNLDIATMQSLKNNPDIIKNYSHIIIDECHHIPAVTFEKLIKQFCGKYILGLSATPNRKDNMQPILYHQIGPIAYEHKKRKTVSNIVKIIKTNLTYEADNYSDLISQIIEDEERNELIIHQIQQHQERNILILTDRVNHIKTLSQLLDKNDIEHIIAYGGLKKKEKDKVFQNIENSKLLVATTSFFGEGIDFPHFDTILFATPISYHGRLVQYLGRIGRGDQKTLAIDLIDNNAMLYSAFSKRKEGYYQMNYELDSSQ